MTRLDDRLFAYEAVTGIFAQSLPETDPVTFDYTQGCMGLIAKPTSGDAEADSKPWQRLIKYMEHLQAVAPAGTFYKLIINGRHGQGFHNVAEDKYGTLAWDEHWSKLDGVDDVSWSDSHLTALGEEQALEASRVLNDQITLYGLPAPQSYVVSPLYRCFQTAYMTYSNLALPADRPFRPVVKEMIRECLGEHTCDRRSTKSVYHAEFPTATFEEGFIEGDVLWKADHRETHDEHDIRTQALLDDVFEHDPSTVISFTSHSGSIASLLRVLEHRIFRLQTGAVIPLLVKATRLSQPGN